ncbi:MAG: gliding motility-associated C-terminal domain-containing protein [Saprospiraceae bacterium]
MNKRILPKRPLLSFSFLFQLSLCLICLLSWNIGSAQVIFTQYVDAPDNNDAIEITNVGEGVANLNEYKLEIYTDGAGAPSFGLALSGQLGPGDSKAFRSPGSTVRELDGFDPYLGQINGNDAWVLRRGGGISDVFGGIGCSNIGPEGWSDGFSTTKNGSWRRFGCITNGFAGDCGFSILSLEWVGSNTINYSGLGVHNFEPFRATITEEQDICEGEFVTLTAGPASAFSFRWSPVNSGNSSIQVNPATTTTYAVTVSNGACQDEKQVVVNVTPTSTISLDDFGSFCESDSPINIPSRQDGVFGRWAGPGIVGNGFLLDPGAAGPGIHTLFFTPNEGNCFLGNSTSYEVSPEAAPVLDPLPSLCAEDESIGLGIEQGGVTGSWSGQGVNNNTFNPSGLSGGIQLTFTPSGCGRSASTTIQVQAPTSPTLESFGTVCELASSIFLSSVQNGITGSWSGSGVSNNQFFPQGNVGNNSLQFTPDAGQCAAANTTSINVSSVQPIFPPFFESLCSNDSPINLGNSLDGVSGNWGGTGVNNNFFDPQSVTGNAELTFFPNAGECATSVSTSISVANATTYFADVFDPICNTSEAFSLNTEQDEVSGVWLGDIVTDNILNPQTSPGTYTIRFSPNERCLETQSRQIEILDGPVISNLQIDPAACERPIGEVTATIQGGQQFTLQYSLDGENYQSQRTFSNLAAGDYTLLVDDGRCVAQDDFTIESTEGSALTTVDITIPATCVSNAQINVTGEGTGNLFYSLNGTDFQAASQFSNLTAGDYQAIIRDANFCFDTLGFNIPTPVEPEISAVNATPTSCGEVNGELQISATGTGQLEYAIDGINFLPLPTYTNLNSGNYVITVRDATGCTITESAFINTSEALEIQQVNTNAATCGTSNGSLNINLNNTGGSYQYAIDDNDFQTSPQFDNLAAGTYQIRVMDNEGCTAETNATITTADEPQINETITQSDACGTNSGQVEVQATAATSLQYAINGGTFQSTNIFTNLSGGEYTLQILDENGCTDNSTFTITATTAPTIATINTQPSDCAIANGEITVEATGDGELTYSFDGNEFSTNATFNQLTPADYSLQVRSSNGCVSEIQTVTITRRPDPIIENLTPIAASCNENNGQISVSANSENGTLQYSLDNSNFQNEANFINLTGGDYIVYIQDASGCTAESAISISTIAPPSVEQLDIQPATCSQANGGLQLSATNGTGAIEFSIDNTNFQTSGNFNNLTAADYQVTLRDAAGCTTQVSATIAGTTQPEIITTNAQPTTCGETNGRLEINTNESVEYSINGTDYQASNAFAELAAATYTVYIRNADNCVATTSVEIANSTSPQVQTVNISDTDCDENTGRFSVVANDGTGVLSYSLDNENFQTSPEFTTLAAGVYTIYVKNESDCLTTTTAAINEAGSPTIEEVNATLANCEDQAGSLQITATGNGNLEYAIDGINFQTENLFSNLASGDYEVTVRAENGCRQITSATVAQTTGVIIDEVLLTDATCTTANGSLNVNIIDNNGAVQYSIDNSNFQNNPNFNNLPAGNYTVFVRDTAACTNEMMVTLTNQGTPEETILTANTCDEAQVGMDTLRLNSIFGCDSLVITQTVFVPSNETNLTVFDCNPAALGRDTLFLQNFAGCDSLVITETLFSEDIQTQLTRSVCAENQVGIDTVFLQSTAGCDSLVITTSVLVIAQENQFTQSVCSTAEIRTDTTQILSVAGCDSILNITNYVFTEVMELFATETRCGAGTDSRDTVIIQSVAGCDSLFLINEILFAEATESFTVGTTCDPNQVGLDTTILTNTAGCDSLMIQDLSLLSSSETIINLTTCNANDAGMFTNILTNSVGCDSTVITNVSLLAADECELQLNIATTNAICNGELSGSVTFSATVGTPPFTFTLNNESIDPITGELLDIDESATLIYLAAGDYTLQVTSANGLNTTQSVTINESSAIVVETLSFPPGCQQENGSLLIANISGGAGSYEYALDGSDFVTIDELPFRLPDALLGGDYELSIRDADGCQIDEIITIAAQSDLIIDLPKQIEIDLGESVELDLGLNFPAASVEWETIEEISCTDCVNPIATPLNTNSYFVVATDERGCQAEANLTIVVRKEREIYLPNVFSPNGDGSNDFFTIFTGKNVAQINRLQIFNYYGDPMFERLEPFEPNVRNLGWDGNFRGERSLQGVYIFVAEVEFVDGFVQRYQGEFALVR